MNEQDFRAALRQTMAVQEAPPPMSDAPVLEAAYRDRKRRRAMWAGAGSAAVVAAVAIGVAVLTPSGTAPGGGIEVGGQPPATANTGETNKTQTAGPHADKATALAAALDSVLPAGYESPEDLKGAGDLKDTLLKRHQSSLVDNINGTDIWSYEAVAPLTKGSGVGTLKARTYAPGWPTTGEGCALTPAEWGAGTGQCVEQTVNGQQVPVVDTDLGGQISQWAAFRHADGTLVFVEQSTTYHAAELPAIDGMPFTATQLAALAADPRFNVD